LTYINVELTNYLSPFDDLPRRTASLVRRMKVSKRVLFSSFNPIALIRIHRLIPEAPIGLLAAPRYKGVWARTRLGGLIDHQTLHIAIDDASPELVNRMHRKRRKVFVYTVNLEKEMRRLFEIGVDGIFTDDPLLARRVLNSARHKIRDSRES
jgi:glycerophosphoryl diester phosphodiesterase